MTEVRKISVSMPPSVVERIKLAAAATGESVSAWLTNAAITQLDEQTRLEIGRIAADELVAEYEAEHGPIPAEVIAEVEAFRGAGAGPDRPAEHAEDRLSMRVVYDAGALIAAERQSRQLLEMHRQTLAAGDRPVVPTIVLGQVWRGTARQAALARVLKGCKLHHLDVVTAKQGGQLCGYAGTSDLADAVVAVLAIRLGAHVVTSDPVDLDLLGEAAGWRLAIFPI